MESDMNLVPRRLTVDDLPRCRALSDAAMWNQTDGDWRFFLREAHAYGVAVPGGVVVASTVAWDVAPGLSWIAMVLVDPAWRGRGYAKLLMQHAIAEAEARGMATALDATPLGEPVYAKLGFVGAVGLRRWRREDAGGDGAPAALPAGLRFVAWGECSEGDVAAWDRAISGMDRRRLLGDWAELMPDAAWGVVDMAGELHGMVLARPGRKAVQVGPIVANRRDVAAALLGRALAAISGPVCIDVPIEGKGLAAVLAETGFQPERDFRRMVRPAGALQTDWSRTWAIGGPDVG